MIPANVMASLRSRYSSALAWSWIGSSHNRTTHSAAMATTSSVSGPATLMTLRSHRLSVRLWE